MPKPHVVEKQLSFLQSSFGTFTPFLTCTQVMGDLQWPGPRPEMKADSHLLSLKCLGLMVKTVLGDMSQQSSFPEWMTSH
jgi:hypothetical protein